MKKRNDQIRQRLIRHKEYFSKHAELGNKEYITSKYIENCLSMQGYQIEKIDKSTGLIATLNDNKDGKPYILFRAEMDALPVGNSIVKHACGHDAHMAIMLSFAEDLIKFSDVNINVGFIFQPAEELCDGANLVLENEFLKSIYKKYVFGIHMWADLPYCKCAAVNGSLMAGGGQFKIIINGGGAHGAFPHLGKDTVIIAAEIITEIHTIIGRQIDPMDSAVISVGNINGGIADNQLSPRTIITGTIRYFSEQTKGNILNFMRNICESKRMKWAVDIDFSFYERVAPVSNNSEIMSLLSDEIYDVFGYDGVINDYKTMAVDDFSAYLKDMVGGYFLIGCQNYKKYPQHHPDFYVDSVAMEKGYELVNNIFRKINEVEQ